jgi:hypothetical protein
VKRRVYLSGGMEYAPGEGRDWRDLMEAWLTETLGWESFNPNSESDRMLAALCPGQDMRALKSDDPPAYRRIVAQLVDHDCREVAVRSDLVICYWEESAMRGAGTKGEITMARYFGKPVYMVTTFPQRDIPGWVLGCTTRFFASFDELKAFLLATRDAAASTDPRT